MTGLSRKTAEDFIKWLQKAVSILPLKMTLSEAKALYHRKIAEEKEVTHDNH